MTKNRFRITTYIDIQQAVLSDVIDENGQPKHWVRYWLVLKGAFQDKVIDAEMTTDRLKKGIEAELIWVERYRKREVKSWNSEVEADRYLEGSS